MEINNSYIKGYINALDNIKTVVNTYKIDAISNEAKEAFNDVSRFIEQVRNNYKELVKDLNNK